MSGVALAATDPSAVAPLDAQVLEVASLRGSLRRELARIAGQIVATRSWERIGFARLADYARERVGLSTRQIHDLAHTHARLAELPLIDAALVAGRLSWTKARLLARVANPSDAARWIERAARVPTRLLEREVRAVDRGSLEAGSLDVDAAGRPTWPSEVIQVRCTPAVQAKFHRVRQAARRVAGEALPTWACMEAVVAEAISARRDVAAELPEPAPLRGESRDPANACAIHGPVSDAVAADEPVDAFELDARLRQIVAREQRLDAELAPLLRRVPQLGERAGLSPRKLRALVRLDRAGDQCPALREAFCDGRLSWVQAHALVGLLALPAVAPFCNAWVARAQHVTVRRLQEDVDAAVEAAAREDAPAPPDDLRRQTRAQRTGGDAAPAPAQETARFFFSAPREVARLLRAVVCSVRRRLECSEGEAWSWLFDHALEAWGANNPRVRREHRVFARDRWRCTVPGCTSYRNLHDHHVVFRSMGGDDVLANRTTLCAFHHLRGVHAGRVRVIGSAPDRLRFELGLRPGQPPLLRYRSGE